MKNNAMTKLEAKRISVGLWNWLAETGSADKDAWPDAKKEQISVMRDRCSLCEYFRPNSAANRLSCAGCPLNYEDLVCRDSDHIYSKWSRSDPYGSRRKHAKEILRRIENWNIEMKKKLKITDSEGKVTIVDGNDVIIEEIEEEDSPFSACPEDFGYTIEQYVDGTFWKSIVSLTNKSLLKAGPAKLFCEALNAYFELWRLAKCSCESGYVITTDHTGDALDIDHSATFPETTSPIFETKEDALKAMEAVGERCIFNMFRGFKGLEPL